MSIALPRSGYCVGSTGESLYTETQLRAALAERDAEIARWTAAWDQLNETTGTKLAAQRKVLEQAHKALNVAVIQNGCYMIMTGEELRKCESAITAIQGVLKCN